MARRHELTDARWVRIEDRSPGKRGDPGRTAADSRRFVNAVRSVLETGAPWADLPARSGRHNPVWRRPDRWSARGVRARVAAALGDPGLEALQLGATTVKAHPVAAAGRRPPAEKKGAPTPAGASGGAGAG